MGCRTSEFDGLYLQSMFRPFKSPEELMSIFVQQFAKILPGLFFEQGGFITRTSDDGLGVLLPSRVLNMIERADIERFAKINSGSLAMNKDERLGILLKVSKMGHILEEPVLTKLNKGNNKPIIFSKFVFADDVILPVNKSFVEFINDLARNKDMHFEDRREVVTRLREAEFQEIEIDQIGTQVVDRYRYIPLSLTIDSIGTPREILHTEKWLQDHKTEWYIHTHCPTEGNWNDVVKKVFALERDPLLTPSDILLLKNLAGAKSSIVFLGYERQPVLMNTFHLALLTAEEQAELFMLARSTKYTLEYRYQEVTRAEAERLMRYYELVIKGTRDGWDHEMT